MVIDLNTVNAIELGDSVAVNGACLTAAAVDGNQVRFDVSSETLSKCLIAEWREGDRVNLETALTLQTPLGGHLVSGHVDGIGSVATRDDAGEFTRMEFDAPKSIGRSIAVKGSIAVDGVSLTTNSVRDHGDDTRFEVMLVPHTLEMTTLGTLQPGSQVHLEIDLIARYLQRLFDSEKGV